MMKSLLLLVLLSPLYILAQSPATTNVLKDTGLTAIASTTSSNYQLSINGSIKLYGASSFSVSSPNLYLINTTPTTGNNWSVNSLANGRFQIRNNSRGVASIGIASNGNVGLGPVATNFTPTSLLSLGDGTYNNKLAVYDDGIGLHAGIGWTAKQLRFHLTSTTDRFSFLATEGGGQELMTILGTGNIGIGTATPTAKLTINGAIAGKSGLKFTQLTSASTAVVSNGKVLTVDASGNVILVTADVTFANGVNGVLRVANGGIGLSTLGTANQQLRVNAAGTALEYFTPSAGSSLWMTNGADMSSTNTGFIGIGTSTNPAPSDAQLKLAVKGAIYAQKLKITQTGWADYVFKNNYQLPSLNEVEAFINKHQHLPDVPTASEVEQNGIDIGNNQVLLLKKIEELTLYAIDQNKKIYELQQQVEALKKRMGRKK